MKRKEIVLFALELELVLFALELALASGIKEEKMKISKWVNEINKLEAGDSFTTKKWRIEAKKDFNGCDGCDLADDWCSEVSCVSKGIIYKKTRRNKNENSK